MAKSFTIPGPLGLKLAAIYREPETPTQTTPAGCPLVILLHGFSGWKEEEHIVTLADELAAAGIAALRFDAPGSGQSDGTWAGHYTVSNYLAAVSSVYDFALANLPIDPDRIAIWGHSMGGMVALIAASRTPGHFVAACGSQPSSGKKNLTPEAEASWKTTGWMMFRNRHFGEFQLPYKHFLDRAQYNLLTDIANFRKPLLLIAGKQDPLVSAASVQAIYDAASEPKQILTYDATHDYKRHPEALAAINRDTLAFFRAHLLAKS